MPRIFTMGRAIRDRGRRGEGARQGGLEILRERLNRIGSNGAFEKTLKPVGIFQSIDDLTDSVWTRPMADFQGAEYGRAQRAQPALEKPLPFALELPFEFAFKFAFLSELIGECHGFGVKGFTLNLAKALLELGDVNIRVENVPQYPLESTLRY